MNSSTKGKVGEREWRDMLIAAGYWARRGQQFAGGADSPDVISTLPIHFEVKRVERLNLREALHQVYIDADGGDFAIAHRWNNGQWLVTQIAPQWFEVVKGKYAHILACPQCLKTGS